jgi:hypothetical protein
MKALWAFVLVMLSTVARGDDRKEAAFGFAKGISLRAAQQLAPLSPVPNAPHYFGTKSPPRGVYPFEIYSIAVGPKSGVCAVVALTRHELDGSKMYKDMADSVLRALMGKYGQPTHTGETSTTRILKWAGAQGPGTFVQLTMHHADDGTAYMEVAYSFSNFEACRQELLGGL